MGASSDKCELAVQLDGTSFNAGGEVSGKVYLSVKETIESNTVWLKVKGVEKCEWKKRPSDANRGTKAKHYNMGVKIPLFNFDTVSIVPGQYTFPFAFMLPENLPGSFKVKRKSYSAEIMYKVKAEISPSNDKCYKKSAPFTVKQVITGERYSVSLEKSAQIITCKCLNKGTTSIKAHLDKNAYLPSEKANITIEADNSMCHVPIKTIEVTLWRTLRLKSNRDNIFYVRDALKTLKTGSVPPSTGLLSQNALKIEVPFTDLRENIEDVCSTKGNKIECAYSFQVRGVLGSINDPNFEVWTLIHPMEMSPQILEAPADWTPTEMPQARLTIDAAFNYFPSAPPMDDDF